MVEWVDDDEDEDDLAKVSVLDSSETVLSPYRPAQCFGSQCFPAEKPKCLMGLPIAWACPRVNGIRMETMLTRCGGT